MRTCDGQGDEEDAVWDAQRDATSGLDVFESTAFQMSHSAFFTPAHTIATIDDDIYGTRSKDNPVKSLSPRKADREGTADAVSDDLFRVTFAVRFRRRSRSQSENARKILDVLADGGKEQSLHGLVATADRGYGSTLLLRSLLRRGVGTMLNLPEHLLRCHPFVCKSLFSVTKADEEEELPLSNEEDEGEIDDSDSRR